tara:strand:+ start:2713 stop:3837 length:1125 start_codon:yes stop_codon:yes gene_type:complete
MIKPSDFYEELKKNELDFYCGVPDSLLASFCAYVHDFSDKNNHIISANEGNAIAIAAGYHLGTNKIPIVYLQNSGLGNAINPLTSLTDAKVYKIPLLLIIGWRGQPGISDEPQHLKQGSITEEQLKLLDIPYHIIGNRSNYKEKIENTVNEIKNTNAPVAILIKKDTFEEYKVKNKKEDLSDLKREEALNCILDLCKSDLIVSTTGKTSREIFELRNNRKEKQRDFLMVGSMGHTSSTALGLALSKPDKRVICLDGDGSMLMHLGSLPIIGQIKPKNLIHILLNNAAHESVGGQPTVADQINFLELSKSSNYSSYYKASNIEEINSSWQEIKDKEGPIFFEIFIKKGSRKNLGRPSETPEENKFSFINAVNDDS